MSKKPIDFDSAFEEQKDPAKQKELDEAFGEGGDVMSIVGVATVSNIRVAFARMIMPLELLPIGKTIDVRRDEHNNILFISNDVLLMATGWDDGVKEFEKMGAEHGVFMFEAITPTKLHRALCHIDGKVIESNVRDITSDEYEKHLAGFYCGALEQEKDVTITVNVNKPIEC